MATTWQFDQRVEDAIRRLLLEEYPHIRPSTLNNICLDGTRSVASSYQARSKEEEGVRPLRFFDLPREIRDIIYEYAVVPADGFARTLSRCQTGGACQRRDDIRHHFVGRSRPSEVSFGQPPVTRVCQQLRNEVLPIFYEKNCFAVCLSHDEYEQRCQFEVISATELLCDWWGAIGAKHGTNIRQIAIHYTRELDKKQLLDLEVLPEDRLVPGTKNYVLAGRCRLLANVIPH